MFGITSKDKKIFIKNISSSSSKYDARISEFEKIWTLVTLSLGLIALFFVVGLSYNHVGKYISPIVSQFVSLKPLIKPQESEYEVFGFAPYWTINKLDSVEFSSLTTFAYFGVPIKKTGGLDKKDYGYTVFKSKKATDIFRRAHDNNVRVILTVTCMDNEIIESFLSSSKARQETIADTIHEVKARGIDGVNIDVEYVGTPDAIYREQFSVFVSDLTRQMHAEIPGSYVTVSVYASSAKQKKLYDISSIGKNVDGVFMMAYDFAVKGSDYAMPTSPLYGHKEGKYSYDIATAVEDFKTYMPANKIILGVPYYGYNYLVYDEPRVKAETRPSWSWKGKPLIQTYEIVSNSIKPEREGWDDLGQVGWKAYYVPSVDAWRMIFLDDARSLGIKYDFAKSQGLAGVGMWALGFDSGKPELWAVLREKFGMKNLADSRNFTEIQ